MELVDVVVVDVAVVLALLLRQLLLFDAYFALQLALLVVRPRLVARRLARALHHLFLLVGRGGLVVPRLFSHFVS